MSVAHRITCHLKMDMMGVAQLVKCLPGKSESWLWWHTFLFL